MFLVVAATLHADWRVYVSEDLMVGTENPYVVGTAEAYQRTLRTPRLIVREGGDDYEIYISWGGYHMHRDRRTVTARFADNEPQEWRASRSTSGEASFITSAKAFIAAMLEHDGEKLVAQAVRATGPESVARWDLSGFEDIFVETFGPLEDDEDTDGEEE